MFVSPSGLWLWIVNSRFVMEGTQNVVEKFQGLRWNRQGRRVLRDFVRDGKSAL